MQAQIIQTMYFQRLDYEQSKEQLCVINFCQSHDTFSDQVTDAILNQKNIVITNFGA